VAVPGTVDFEKGLVITAPNFPCLTAFSSVQRCKVNSKGPHCRERCNAPQSEKCGRVLGEAIGTSFVWTLGRESAAASFSMEKLWRGVMGIRRRDRPYRRRSFLRDSMHLRSSGCLEVYASALRLVRMTSKLDRYPTSCCTRVMSYVRKNLPGWSRW